jgi:hypothetical protein
MWALGAWLLLWELCTQLTPSVASGPLFSRFAHDVALVLSSLLCVWGGIAGPRRERAAWVLIGAGLLSWSLGEIWYTAVLWDAETIPVPSPADAGYLAPVPFCLAGLVLLLRARLRAVPPRCGSTASPPRWPWPRRRPRSSSRRSSRTSPARRWRSSGRRRRLAAARARDRCAGGAPARDPRPAGASAPSASCCWSTAASRTEPAGRRARRGRDARGSW